MAMQQGMQRCRVLHKDTPDYIIRWLCNEHNRHHRGSGATVSSVIAEALADEAKWKQKCTDEGITSKLPNYQKRYDAFIRQNSSFFADSANQFQEAKSLGHSLQSLELLQQFEDYD